MDSVLNSHFCLTQVPKQQLALAQVNRLKL